MRGWRDARTQKGLALALAAAFSLGGAAAAFGVLAKTSLAPAPVFFEVPWPFPIDQWGTGKAFRCAAMKCGVQVDLYLHAKLGSCNCTIGIASDEELDRMSDFDLLGGDVSALRGGRPVAVGRMQGRSGTYAVHAAPGKGAISVVVNDRCDMVVATAVLSQDRLEAMEPAVLQFLNSPTVLRWAELALGL